MQLNDILISKKLRIMFKMKIKIEKPLIQYCVKI